MNRGPEAVRAALIEAAADLFAEEGDVAVRKIAARAGVNHGLVHHYFGSKEALRRAVVAHLSHAQAAELDAIDPDDPVASSIAAFAAARRHDRFLKFLARALLDGEPPSSFQETFPVVRRVAASLERAGVDEAPMRLAHGLAASLGWMLFGPWIAAATGVDAARAEAALLERFVEDIG